MQNQFLRFNKKQSPKTVYYMQLQVSEFISFVLMQEEKEKTITSNHQEWPV